MNNLEYISNSEFDTMTFAKKLAAKLNKGDIIILSGDLGTGKTKFVEGFLSNFNLQDEISSPTFNIVNEYRKDNITIFHFDVYRLTDSSEFYEIGGEEFFDQGICLIEWGEIIEDAIPKEHISIKIERFENDEDDFENKRIIYIEAIGEKYEKIIERITEN